MTEYTNTSSSSGCYTIDVHPIGPFANTLSQTQDSGFLVSSVVTLRVGSRFPVRTPNLSRHHRLGSRFTIRTPEPFVSPQLESQIFRLLLLKTTDSRLFQPTGSSFVSLFLLNGKETTKYEKVQELSNLLRVCVTTHTRRDESDSQFTIRKDFCESTCVDFYKKW